MFLFPLALYCNTPSTHVPSRTNIKTWPQSVGVSLSGFSMSCNCTHHLQHSSGVDAFSCSTEARSSIVISRCRACDAYALLPVDPSLLLPSHLHQGLACCHYDTWGEEVQREKKKNSRTQGCTSQTACLLDKPGQRQFPGSLLPA